MRSQQLTYNLPQELKEEIYQKASKVFDLFLDNQDPLEKFIKKNFGVEVKCQKLPRNLAGKSKDKTIWVNSKLSGEERKYVIFHELGKILFAQKTSELSR